MTAPTAAPLRAVRAAVLTATVLLLAVGAHAGAGGMLPSVSLLLGAGIPVACAAVVLARRLRGPVALLSTLTLAQVVLHEAFSTATTACHANASTVVHHGAHAVCASDASAVHAHGTSTTMTALHAVATLLTAALLAHGERVAARLATWIGAHLLRPRPALTPPVAVAAQPFVTEAVPRTEVVPVGSLSRRGPPARRAFAFQLVTA